MTYFNRQDAGKKLAEVLRRFKGSDTVVLALPRGGIVLGAEVAKALDAPLGVVLVRKIGHPGYQEYAIGAVAEDDEPVFNRDELVAVDDKWLVGAVAAARKLLAHRRDLYYGADFSPPPVKDKRVILVDDGIATGLTMEAAVRAMRNKHAKRVVVAVPIASSESVAMLQSIADEVIVLDNPESFMGAVGGHYRSFEQVDDDEVRRLLRDVRDGMR